MSHGEVCVTNDDSTMSIYDLLKYPFQTTFKLGREEKGKGHHTLEFSKVLVGLRGTRLGEFTIVILGQRESCRSHMQTYTSEETALAQRSYARLQNSH